MTRWMCVNGKELLPTRHERRRMPLPCITCNDEDWAEERTSSFDFITIIKSFSTFSISFFSCLLRMCKTCCTFFLGSTYSKTLIRGGGGWRTTKEVKSTQTRYKWIALSSSYLIKWIYRVWWNSPGFFTSSSLVFDLFPILGITWIHNFIRCQLLPNRPLCWQVIN